MCLIARDATGNYPHCRNIHNKIDGGAFSLSSSPRLITIYASCKRGRNRGHDTQTQFYHLQLLMIFKGHLVNMPYYFFNSLHDMTYTYQINVGDKERSLFHHGLIKILMSHRLGELGDTWESFLMCNGFGENEEWPRRRLKTRKRRIKTKQVEPELEDSGS